MQTKGVNVSQGPESRGQKVLQGILGLIAVIAAAWFGWAQIQQTYLTDKKREACEGRFAVAKDAKVEVTTESTEYKDLFVVKYQISGDRNRKSLIHCYVIDYGSYVLIKDIQGTNDLDLWVKK